jgi:hypothetical protein
MMIRDMRRKADGRTRAPAPDTARLPGVRLIPIPLALLTAVVG